MIELQNCILHYGFEEGTDRQDNDIIVELNSSEMELFSDIYNLFQRESETFLQTLASAILAQLVAMRAHKISYSNPIK